MAYVKKIWKDYPDTTTPILASDMNNIENGIEAVDTALENIENGIEAVDTALENLENNVEDVFNGEGAMGSIRVDDIKCKNLSKVNFIRNINGDPDIYTTTAEVEENRTIVISAIKSRMENTNVENPNVFAIKNVEFYNQNGQLINEVDGYAIYLVSGSYDIEMTVTTPENCTYMIVDFCNYNGDLNYNTSVSNIQIEYNEKTDFTPYKEFSNKHIYSTNEHIVGTWVDGKTLYSKTITTNVPNSTTEIIPHNIQNVDTIWIDCGASYFQDGKLPSTRYAINDFDWHVAVSSTHITKITETDRSYGTMVITLQYTKNTQPAMMYSPIPDTTEETTLLEETE